jgi:intraflagellar transport protein 52
MNEPKRIVFDETKQQKYTISKGFRKLTRKLKNTLPDIQFDTEPTQIDARLLQTTSLFVIACPQKKYTEAEFETLKHYIDSGGSVLVTLTDGGEGNSNINYLLEEYSISSNSDGIVRTSYHRMPHPKEVLLNTNDKCLIARELQLALSQVSSEFCYPYGCSLNLEKPSQCLALSGPISFPVDRPIIALHQTPGTSLNQPGGRIIVSGSTHIFHDNFLDLFGCANLQLAEIIFAWLLNLDGQLELQANFGDVEIAEYKENPCVEHMVNPQKGILEGGDNKFNNKSESGLDLLQNASEQGESGLYRVDTQLLPNTFKAYENLDIKKESLNLIPPNFETPLPPLQPAVFPAIFDEPNTPALELFDLDQELAPEQTRLAQLTNKCNTKNLEYYIQECGRILNIDSESNKQSNDFVSASSILYAIARDMAGFKMPDAGL